MGRYFRGCPSYSCNDCNAFTYSISNGIALAFVSYALIKLFTGKFSSTSPAIWVIAILSVVSFAVA